MLSEAGMPDDGNKDPDGPDNHVFLRNSPCDFKPCLNQGVSVEDRHELEDRVLF